MATNAASKAKATKTTTKKAATSSSSTKTSKPVSFHDRVLRMWAVSLVLVVLFLIGYAFNTMTNVEEGRIRRETYITNLSQFYQQEAQACLNPASLGISSTQSPADCLDDLNQSNRFAELLDEWGADELLLSGNSVEEL